MIRKIDKLLQKGAIPKLGKVIHKEANTSGKLESIYLLSSAGFYIEIVKLCHNNNFKNSNKMGIATFFPKTKSGNSSEDQFKVHRLSAVVELPTK